MHILHQTSSSAPMNLSQLEVQIRGKKPQRQGIKSVDRFSAYIQEQMEAKTKEISLKKEFHKQHKIKTEINVEPVKTAIVCTYLTEKNEAKNSSYKGNRNSYFKHDS